MSYPRINLTGIRPDDFDYGQPAKRNSRKDFTKSIIEEAGTTAEQPPPQKPLKITADPPKKKPPKKITTKKPSSRTKYIIVLLVFSFFTISTIMNLIQNAPSVESPIKHNLRKMIRMTCASENIGTYCTSKFKGEDYVVSVNGCKNVYEFNGIPFTDVYTDAQGNYRIPTSNDLTLVMKEPCNDIAATVDSDKKSFDSYASHTQQEGAIERLVWITHNCYTDFTVKIDDIIVFDKTPSTMIEQKRLLNKTAFIYEPEVENVNGAISVSGRGCVHPIFIYVKRTI